jgi:hypothetical protein
LNIIEAIEERFNQHHTTALKNGLLLLRNHINYNSGLQEYQLRGLCRYTMFSLDIRPSGRFELVDLALGGSLSRTPAT